MAEKIVESGVLETTVVVKWRDFSGEMIGAPGHEKEDFKRDYMIGHHGFQIYSKKGEFTCYFMLSDGENKHFLKKYGYACKRTGSKRWMWVWDAGKYLIKVLLSDACQISSESKGEV